MRWFDKVKNVEITRRTGLFHVGDIIQRRRHSLFDHIARMDPLTPAHMALKLCRDISMGRRVPAGLRRPRGRPRTTWSNAEGHGQAGVNTMDPGAGPPTVGAGRSGPDASWDEEEEVFGW